MWSIFENVELEEDETISNAFSSRGIFKIRSEEEVLQYPNVQASIKNKKMVVAIDKSVVLLEDEMVAKCSFLSFTAKIEAITISSSGNLIICGLQDGQLYGIFIKGVPVFNVAVQMEDTQLDGGMGRTFCSIHELDGLIYATCTNGSVYCLSKIDESPLEANLDISLSDTEALATAENLLGPVTIERVATGRSGLRGISAAVLLPAMHASSRALKQPMILASVQNELHFSSNSADASTINIPDCYEGVKHIFNLENVLLVLTYSGHLLEVCPLTRLICLQPLGSGAAGDEPMLIEEMLVTECSDANIELLVLTKEDAVSGNGRAMRIIEYPSLKCSSELEVPQHTWLVQQAKCSVNLYYLSGQQPNAAKQPTAVEMVLVSETQPAERFKRLIAKGHLEEAESFGRQFELSLQPIFEAQAKRLLLELNASPDSDSDQLTQRFEELLQILRQIESKAFFRNNRSISLPTRRLLERYLNELLQHFGDATADERDVLEIAEQLHRLGTLAIIDPCAVDVDWAKFVYQPNLVKTIVRLFNSDMAAACLVWRRHASVIMPQLSDNELSKLLTLLPSNLEAFSLVQWLRQFVPTVCGTHPHMMPIITDWTVQKTRALQYAQHWPEIGLEFSTKVIEIFEDIDCMHSDIDRQQERNICKLRNLMNALQDLAVLKNSYNLTITLDNYMQDSNDETAVYILERVHLDRLQSLVKDFLYPIYQERGAAPVAALRRYIGQLVASRALLTAWLQRAVVCTELLHDEDDRLESALLVLQSAPVPWPAEVAPLVRLRQSTHPLALEISSAYEFQVIKIMKVKYGWPADSAADINLELFMRRIVHFDLPDMLDDIRTLTKAAPLITNRANCHCCYQLVRRGKVDLAYEFFKTLHAAKNARHSDELLEFFADLLETTVVPASQGGELLEEQRQLIDFFKLIAGHAGDESTRQRAHTIRRRFVLQQQFGLCVPTVQALVSLTERSQLLDLGIANINERARERLTATQSDGSMSRFMYSEIRALSAALSVPRAHGIWRLARRLHCLSLTCTLAHALLEYVAPGTSALAANREDVVELALVLIVQQMLAVRSKGGVSTLGAPPLGAEGGSDAPLALPLAYELLVRAYAVERKRPADLLELLKFLRVASAAYPSASLEDYYSSSRQCANDDEEIERALMTAESSHSNNSGGNDSDGCALNGGDGGKKRYSVSAFDVVDLPPQQAKHNSCSAEQTAVVRFVARTLLLLAVCEPATPQHNLLFAKLREHLPNNVVGDDIRTDVEGARSDFSQALEQLIKTKAHDVWYTMAQHLLQHQQRVGGTATAPQIITAEFVSQQLPRVFRNALSQRENVNFSDLLVMLLADDQQGATLLYKLQRDLRTDQQKLNLFTLLEMYHAPRLPAGAEIEAIRAKRVKHFYYMEFCQQDASIQSKFNADVDDVTQLLREFQNKQPQVQLLERMSADFRLDHQELLIEQLLNILASQELQYEIKADSHGEERLVVANSVEMMRRLCQPYLNEIKNTKALAGCLLDFIDRKVNFYFYELYVCVIDLLLCLDAAPSPMHIWSSILHFLRHKMVTRRRNLPGQLETDLWLQSQTELSVLPNIARYRLPFKPIVELSLKDILLSELNVANCESWFPLIQLHMQLPHTQLNGSPDDIAKMIDYHCMAAVKNSIVDYKAENRNDAWHLQPTNNAFLKSIQRLVRHVSNPSKAFMILYFVANYAPEGADQVEASYECYRYAQRNESCLTDSKCQEQLVKIRRKYPTLKTQHLLHCYGLTEQSLLRLVENPVELIHKLYLQEVVLRSGSKLDINAVATEIAMLHDLEVDALQFQLLQKWLSVNLDCADSTVLDETFFEEHPAAVSNGGRPNGAEDADDVAKNVMRAHYVLSSWPKMKALQFLVAHIFPTDGTVNTAKQMKMCECFVKLNDGSASFASMLAQRDYMAIKCVHGLKQLDYKTSVEKFAACDKMEWLLTLWQNRNASALSLMAHICLGYDIYVPKVWNGILRRMVELQMTRELNSLVDVLSCQAGLLQTAGLVRAWENVLLRPFINANRTRSFQQEELLNKTLFRLQSCPVMQRLNLLEFAQHCVQLERIHIAAVLLVLCKQPESRKEIRELISLRQPLGDAVRKDILALKETGILPVILNVALNELNL